MKRKQVWRYYCEHCKKSGGHPAYMEAHERSCYLNPNRICDVCDTGAWFGRVDEAEAAMLARLAVTGRTNEGFEIDETLLTGDDFSSLVDSMEGCPACAMAVVAQKKWKVLGSPNLRGLIEEYRSDLRAEQANYAY